MEKMENPRDSIRMEPSMMLLARRSLIVLLAAASLGGCAANVTRSIDAPPLPRPAGEAGRNVAMSLTRGESAQPAEDWAAFKEEWQTSMTAASSAAGARFSLLPDGSSTFAGPGVLLKTKVNDFRYVSQAKRYGLGVFTGNAHMDIEVEFVEQPGGRVLGKRQYSTTSSGGQGIFSAMSPKQVEAVSKQIVGEIAGR
ncbi:MAG TPA: hypothetical protein PKA20_09445 [Burkholderiaceae bacterium]|nr:hypothetical protein [Burkholderiaceae bacterium]